MATKDHVFEVMWAAEKLVEAVRTAYPNATEQEIEDTSSKAVELSMRTITPRDI